MAEVVKIDDLRQGYIDLVSYVYDNGATVSPRGMETREVQDLVVELSNPVDAVPLGINRKLNTAIGAAEAIQLIAGISDGEMLTRASKGNFAQFIHGGRLPGAYGPRLHDQLPTVVRQLAEDSDTRQAGAMIWRHDELDLARAIKSKDVPCTVSLFWNIREVDGSPRLNASTFMRSNDVWWGVAYDFWMFTRLQLTMAWALGVEVGTYTHHAVSMHIYARDFDKVDTLTSPETDFQSSQIPPALGYGSFDSRPGIRSPEIAETRWRRARSNAVFAARSSGQLDIRGAEWYRDRLAKISTKDYILCSKCRYVLPANRDFFDADQLVRNVGRCRRCLDLENAHRVYLSQMVDPSAELRKTASKYGIDAAEYYSMLEAQEYLCATCREIPDNGRYQNFVIDHNHATGRARGLLCSKCNHALGLIDDDAETARRMMRYLRGNYSDGTEGEL